MPSEIERTGCDFTPGPWKNLSQPEIDSRSMNLTAAWSDYKTVRRGAHSRDRLSGSEIRHHAGPQLALLSEELEMFRGHLVEGRYDMPFFYDDAPEGELPRQVKFKGGGGFSYAKDFVGVLGSFVESDVLRVNQDTRETRIVTDELLLAIGPTELMDDSHQRLFATRKEALTYRHAFGIKQFAGRIALLPLDSISELGIARPVA